MSEIEGALPVDEKLSFTQAALKYLRIKLMISGKGCKHVCPKCGGNVFLSTEESSDPYFDTITAYCKTCCIKSDTYYYPKYNFSPIEFAEGALQTSIDDFERRAKM